MSFRSLVEMSDKLVREELEDYFIVHKSRADNMINCLETGAKNITELREENKLLKDQITELEEKLSDSEEELRLKSIVNTTYNALNARIAILEEENKKLRSFRVYAWKDEYGRIKIDETFENSKLMNATILLDEQGEE